MNCLSPSILSADYCNLARDIAVVDEAGAQYIHIDVMDGLFTPQITIGAPVVSAIRDCTDKVLDVHLMIDEPDRYVEDFAKAGADIISVHAEACTHLDRTIEHIKSLNVMASVALNPSTDLETIKYILPKLDMVLLMSVNPGYAGQKFIGYTLDKLRDLSVLMAQTGANCDVEVDGGINLDNVTSVLDAGANIIVAGSAVFKGDAAGNVRSFLEKMS